MDDAVGQWRRYLVRRGYSRHTTVGQVRIVRRYLDHVGEGWRSVTFRDVEAWAGTLRVMPSSQRTMLHAVRGFYRWARREGLVERDPTAIVDMPRVPPGLPRPVPDAVIAHVLAVAPTREATMIGLMATAGLRCCEVAALDWSDVDLHAGTMRVRGKGSKERIVGLADEALRMLAALDEVAGPVFRSDRMPRLTAKRVSQIVGDAFRDAGYRYSAHQLRHRAATVALSASGGDLLAVRDMLGHSSVSTTQIYTRVAAGRALSVSRAVSMPVA